MQQLLSNNLWAVVSKMSKAAKRIQAALAYVSTIENLHLNKGDTLSAPLETISWNQFQKLLKSVGVRADIGKNSTRAISVSEILELQKIWPRIKRPRKR